MKLGTDIIEIARIERAVAKDSFAKRVYTGHELAYAKSRGKQKVASLAGMYAAKEAFVKALGIGLRLGTFQDIEIRRDEYGAPFIQLSGVFKDIFNQKGFTSLEVSISHCRDYAVATVVAL
ncbi:MAG: holo-[acyl-carrier-protein] synthase [Veillonella sp.]|uniref:holo-ACP synthase n=1 Tax=Veillonella sp. TaxID=1926307 RepID=UPI0025FB4F3B|nr:holo-ACP synthase [Veillonella sp.]MBE6079639.1 holo-[acyl-carrier-protein] synthase [Veillonella sp.]